MTNKLPTREEVEGALKYIEERNEWLHLRRLYNVIRALASAVPCEGCGGEGTYTSKWDAPPMSVPYICPSCNGTGKAYPEVE